MKTLLNLTAGLGLWLALALPLFASASPATDREITSVREQLQRYETALNAADTNAVMALYATDSVFMPQHSLPAVGRDAVRVAYNKVFASIKLDIRFEIDEIRLLSPEWAMARTRSNGTLKVLGSSHAPSPEANQEIFLLHHDQDGQWRFARYIFSTTNPPVGQSME